MATKVKIGFVGVGGMGQCAHLRNYVTVPECEVVASHVMRGMVQPSGTESLLESVSIPPLTAWSAYIVRAETVPE